MRIHRSIRLLAYLLFIGTFLDIALIGLLQIHADNIQEENVRLSSVFHTQNSEQAPADIPIVTKARDVAAAMDIPAADLISADFTGSDPRGFAVERGRLGAHYPIAGATFAVLSSGHAEDASLPDLHENQSSELGGWNTVHGHDLVQLHVQLQVPGYANCVNIDYTFYSEEFFISHPAQFNDTFTAQLATGIPTTTQLITETEHVSVAHNFAVDDNGNGISVSSITDVITPTYTTYTGATPVLSARTAVTPNTVIDIYFSVQDIGDSQGDSAVFLDNFYWSQDAHCLSGPAIDTDQDGLLDIWETEGLTFTVIGTATTVVTLPLPQLGADPYHKDIFVEIDYLETLTRTFKPDPEAIEKIVRAFNSAPIANPDGTTGIHLHVDFGPEAPLVWAPTTANPSQMNWGNFSQSNVLTPSLFKEYRENPGVKFVSHRCIESEPATLDWENNFTQIKNGNFSFPRSSIFHYSIWVEAICPELIKISGTSHIVQDERRGGLGASEFIVSVGADASINMQAGTFMHELGHDLGLRHGGADDINAKPNYLSVMNYLFQFDGLLRNNTAGHFDYSRHRLPDINEYALSEMHGIFGNQAPVAGTIGTRYYCPSHGTTRATDNASQIDWNCNSIIGERYPISSNVNDDHTRNSEGSSATLPVFSQRLTSQTDWDKLIYTGGSIGRVPVAAQTLNIAIDPALLDSVPPIQLLDDVSLSDALAPLTIEEKQESPAAKLDELPYCLSFNIEPYPISEVSQGEIISFSIKTDTDANNFDAVQLTIEFAPMILQAVDSEGNLTSQVDSGDLPGEPSFNQVSNSSGLIQYNHSVEDKIAGKFTIAQIHFAVQKPIPEDGTFFTITNKPLPKSDIISNEIAKVEEKAFCEFPIVATIYGE